MSLAASEQAAAMMSVFDIGAARERLRRRETRADDSSSFLHEAEPNEPGLLLENHRIRYRPPFPLAFLRQDISGADIGMAGERQFGARREDANFRRVRRILRRQYEGGLGQIELGRYGLHLRVRQRRRIGHDR